MYGFLYLSLFNDLIISFSDIWFYSLFINRLFLMKMMVFLLISYAMMTLRLYDHFFSLHLFIDCFCRQVTLLSFESFCLLLVKEHLYALIWTLMIRLCTLLWNNSTIWVLWQTALPNFNMNEFRVFWWININ